MLKAMFRKRKRVFNAAFHCVLFISRFLDVADEHRSGDEEIGRRLFLRL